jgi:hypothetical protein
MAQPRIRFVGDSETCAWLGVNFKRGEWADHQLDADQLARVAEHPHFDLEPPAAARPPPKAR